MLYATAKITASLMCVLAMLSCTVLSPGTAESVSGIQAEFFGHRQTISGRLTDYDTPDKGVLKNTKVQAELHGSKIIGFSDEYGQFDIQLPASWLEDGNATITLSVAGSDSRVAFTADKLLQDSYRKDVLDKTPFDPFELAVADDGRVFYIERLGAVKMVLPASQSAKMVGQLKVYEALDDGLLGLALDPDFSSNNWMYLYYSILDSSENVISRFTLRGDTLDLQSEKIILRVPVQRETPPCHAGGSLAFDSNGNLYLSTGDNINPFDSDGYCPTDERVGREFWDAQASSADTNDLRGKILRIHPEADGSYTIPEGNLFPPGSTNTRPEIFIMGSRNPFRIAVDQKTNTLYWGDVGPDARKMDAARGPAGFDEINQAQSAGNYGWPHFVADNRSYVQYDFATEISGRPWIAHSPINSSANNKGLHELPAARAAFISYPYATSASLPQLESGGRCAMGGPVYYFNEGLTSNRKLSKDFDSSVFFYDWMRGWIMVGKLDGSEALVSVERFMPDAEFIRPMDLELGPDGALYLIEWGSNYGGSNEDAQIVRLQAGVELRHEQGSDAELGGDALLLEKFSSSLSGGDASKGREFFESPKAGCTYCHKIGDHGGLIGPDLSHIGQGLSRQELLEAIIQPSKKIDPQYQPLLVQMKTGESYAGTANEENDEELTLNSPESGLVILNKSDIKVIIRGASPMPAGMGNTMTEEEVRNLVEFMSQLSQKS